MHRSMNSYGDLSDMALKNVLALADGEDPEDPDPGEDDGGGNVTTWQIGKKTITTEIYTATSPGWSWSTEGNIWLFKGTRTENWPPNYLKETVSVEISCCRLKGTVTTCDYEVC